jgi:hypothetical protein
MRAASVQSPINASAGAKRSGFALENPPVNLCKFFLIVLLIAPQTAVLEYLSFSPQAFAAAALTAMCKTL